MCVCVCSVSLVGGQAVLRSRKVFQRLRCYCVHRAACTLHLLCFFFFAIVAVNPDSELFYGRRYPGDPTTAASDPASATACVIDHNVAFTLPVLALVVVTLLVDAAVLTVASDKVFPDRRPLGWDVAEVRCAPCACLFTGGGSPSHDPCYFDTFIGL